MLQAARRALLRYLSEVKRATKPRPYDFKEELMLWDFTQDNILTRWDCICDQDVHGHSTAALDYNGKGTGVIFHGSLSTELPADEAVRYSGYCAIRSKPLKESWFEKSRLDVSEYDAFELRLRGDGRRFIANVGAPNLARRDDVWQCFVFTRGGPEWETVQISLLITAVHLPFGDFFVTHRGYMQDSPFSFPRSSVSTFGLLLADRVNGAFELELQYIKAVRTMLPQRESRNVLQ